MLIEGLSTPSHNKVMPRSRLSPILSFKVQRSSIITHTERGAWVWGYIDTRMHTLGSVAVHTLQNEDTDIWATWSRLTFLLLVTHRLSSLICIHHTTRLAWPRPLHFLSFKRNQARCPDHMTAQSAARGRGRGERWPHITVRSTICQCKHVVLRWTLPNRGTDRCASPNCANKQVVFETWHNAQGQITLQCWYHI